jgi:hypothetical protein|tara:strand:- start:439 stop:663 length:225 start_codon:yes stop_codon:yes gene_type:complete
MSKKDKAMEKIEEISEQLEAAKLLYKQLEEIDGLWDEIEWGNFQEPHHFNIELPRVMHAVSLLIERIELRLEMI